MPEIKNLPHSHISFNLNIPAKDWQTNQDKVIIELGKQIQIDGFRKGHTPPEAVIEKIGQEKLRNETLNKALSPIYAKFVTENKIDVVAPPKITIQTWEPEAAVSVEVAVRPDIDITPLKSIKVKKEQTEIKDTDIEKTITELKQRFITYTDTDRPCQNTDRVEINFAGSTPDGVPMDGTQSKNHPVILGQNQLLPDFEKNIIGKKKDEKFEFTMKFPTDYHGKNVAGKDIVFKVEMKRIEEGSTPTDEELSEKIFDKKTTSEEMKKQIKTDMQKGHEHESAQKAEEKVIKKILSTTKIELPEEMINEELHRVRTDRDNLFRQRGQSAEDYCKHMKITPEQYEEQLKKSAKEQIIIRLTLDKLIQTEKIELNPEEKNQIEKRIAEVPKEQQQTMRLQHTNMTLVKKTLSQFIS